MFDAELLGEDFGERIIARVTSGTYLDGIREYSLIKQDLYTMLAEGFISLEGLEVAKKIVKEYFVDMMGDYLN